MTLPTFLGIGVIRGGTTWLHELLTSHPEVFVPTRRKEVCFFDQYYERGLRWYERFFPSEVEAERYSVIGEISPTYLHCLSCPERIARVPSITKLMIMVRNPVDRAYSQYSLATQLGRTLDTFETFLDRRPNAIQWGFYSRYLTNYLRFFDRDQILVLVHECAVSDVTRAKYILSDFLGISAERFPEEAGNIMVNRSYVPKARAAFRISEKVVDRLIAWDMDWVVNVANRVGINRKWLFGQAGSLPPMKEETRQRLKGIYKEEIRELESLFLIDLTCWK
jgi:hypothetical protein